MRARTLRKTTIFAASAGEVPETINKKKPGSFFSKSDQQAISDRADKEKDACAK